tara:strand:- start:900 stop:1469 length:570 start_codon:yes stop_codon:yes gene_type:complete
LFTSLDYSVKVYHTALDLLADFPLSNFGCILLDLRLPDIGGLQLQQEIVGLKCHLPIIFMTSHVDSQSAVKAMKAGAFDFVDKPVNLQEILEITQRALRLCARLNEEAKLHKFVLDKLAQLTAREGEICRLLATGSVSKQIAHTLGISQNTVEVHRNNIMKKLEANSIVDLTRLLLVTEDQLFDELKVN